MTAVHVRYHGVFATSQLPDGVTLPLYRLRYGGSANTWGFAIYLASRDGYENRVDQDSGAVHLKMQMRSGRAA